MSYSEPSTVTAGETTSASKYNQIITAIKAIWKGISAGDMDYYTGSSDKARLPIGSNGQVLQVVSGVPAWGNVCTLFSSPRTNTNWDGDNHGVGTTTISANSFNSDIPTNAKAILIALAGEWASAGNGNLINVVRSGASNNCVLVRAHDAGIASDTFGIVPLNGSGELDIKVDGISANVYIYCWGYII